MLYGRAYIQGGAVVLLHVSDMPIDLVALGGCDMFDLTLSERVEASALAFDDGAVIGAAVLTCTSV